MTNFSKLTKNSDPTLAALIVANVSLFFIVAVIGAFDAPAYFSIYNALSLSPEHGALVARPWTLLSYAFVQTNILHLAFNMLWLYGFGRLMLLRCSSLTLLAAYCFGAIGGGAVFLICSTAFGDNAAGVLIGSSSSIIAVAVTSAILMPDLELNLPLLGSIKLKWIVGVVILLFCIGLSAPNAGGNLAHIGGAIVGAIVAMILRSRTSVSDSTGYRDEYALLTTKIRQSGYNALSEEEKRRFFELSSRHRS